MNCWACRRIGTTWCPTSLSAHPRACVCMCVILSFADDSADCVGSCDPAIRLRRFWRYERIRICTATLHILHTSKRRDFHWAASLYYTYTHIHTHTLAQYSQRSLYCVLNACVLASMRACSWWTNTFRVMVLYECIAARISGQTIDWWYGICQCC